MWYDVLSKIGPFERPWGSPFFCNSDPGFNGCCQTCFGLSEQRNRIAQPISGPDVNGFSTDVENVQAYHDERSLKFWK